MTISCSDFTDGILDVMLKADLIRAEDIANDDPGQQMLLASQVLHNLIGVCNQANRLAELLSSEEAVDAREVEGLVREVSEGAKSMQHACLASDRYPDIVGSASGTRWVMDLNSGSIVEAEDVQTGAKLSTDEIEALQAEIVDEEVQRPGDHGAMRMLNLPGWAAKTAETAAKQRAVLGPFSMELAPAVAGREGSYTTVVWIERDGSVMVDVHRRRKNGCDLLVRGDQVWSASIVADDAGRPWVATHDESGTCTGSIRMAKQLEESGTAG